MAMKYMEQYDTSRTGKLSRDEVRQMAADLLNKYTPAVGGLTEEDVTLIMCVGGLTCQEEIEAKDLPVALAVVATVREENKWVHDLFLKYDADKSGNLQASQLTALLKEINGGEAPDAASVKYIMTQLEPRGKDDPIAESQLKAAIACWHVQQEDDAKKATGTESASIMDTIGHALMPRTMRRSKQQGEAQQMKEIAKSYLQEFDKSKTGKLSRQEVKDMATSFLTQYTPLVGGLTEDDLTMIMCCGGERCKEEITVEELPEAIAVMVTIREFSQELHELFLKYDKDGTKSLSASQLKDLLTDLHNGQSFDAQTLEYIMKKLEPRGSADPIEEKQLKAAIACWYVLQDDKCGKIKKLFNTWDLDGTGVISLSNFTTVMLKLCPGISKTEIEAVFRQADVSNTDHLDYKEFFDFLWQTGGNSIYDQPGEGIQG